MSVHQRDPHGDPPPCGTEEQTAEEQATDPRPSHSSVRRRRAMIATLTAFGTAFIVAIATGVGGDAYHWIKPRLLGTPTQPPYVIPKPTPTVQPPTSTPTTSTPTTSISTTSAPTTPAFTATAPRT